MTEADIQQQLAFNPDVSGKQPGAQQAIVIGGMGASALAGKALQFLELRTHLLVHEGYDLPPYIPAGAVFIAVSYSGNTEETVSFAKAALERGLPLCIVTSGGELGQMAKDHALPMVLVPTGIAPRNALVYLLRSLLALAAEQSLLDDIAAVAWSHEDLESEGTRHASTLHETVPLIYVSARNAFVGALWKIMLNETAKIPASYSLVPASNHYELQSFDETAPHAALARSFLHVCMRDSSDDARIARRMEIMSQVLREQNGRAESITVEGSSRAEQLVRAWLTAYFTAQAVARSHQIDPDSAPLTESFKKRL